MIKAVPVSRDVSSITVDLESEISNFNFEKELL